VTTKRRRRAAKLMMFGGSLLAGAIAWAYLKDPGGWKVGLLFAGSSEILLPGMILCVLTVPTGLREAMTPRYERIAQRKAVRVSGLRRPPVKARLKRMLMRAYRGRCVSCHSRVLIQYEHRCPYSLGGKTWFFNMTLLCSVCNEAKSSYWVMRDGWVADGHGLVNKRLARKILRRERRAACNPLVYWRAAWAWF